MHNIIKEMNVEGMGFTHYQNQNISIADENPKADTDLSEEGDKLRVRPDGTSITPN
jgi:hypothetical protein